MEKIIETSALSKSFGNFQAVNGLSLSIGRGEIYGILGLNGAGKTTTIRMLLGLIKPSRGSMRICGEEIKPGGKGPWHRTGSLVEVPSSYPELSVRENLEIVRRMRNIKEKNAVEKVAGKLKLLRYIDKKAGKLSLGNAQRLGLAKALIHNPEVLILDEPSNGLDPSGIVEVRKLLIDLSRNHSTTVFVSSHILDEVARFTTRIGVIHEGKLLKEISTAEISSIRNKCLLVAARDNKGAARLLSEKGYRVGENDSGYLELADDRAMNRPEDVAKLLVSSGFPPIALWEKKEDLEDLFLSIIKQEEKTDE